MTAPLDPTRDASSAGSPPRSSSTAASGGQAVAGLSSTGDGRAASTGPGATSPAGGPEGQDSPPALLSPGAALVTMIGGDGGDQGSPKAQLSPTRLYERTAAMAATGEDAAAAQGETGDTVGAARTLPRAAGLQPDLQMPSAPPADMSMPDPTTGRVVPDDSRPTRPGAGAPLPNTAAAMPEPAIGTPLAGSASRGLTGNDTAGTAFAWSMALSGGSFLDEAGRPALKRRLTRWLSDGLLTSPDPEAAQDAQSARTSDGADGLSKWPPVETVRRPVLSAKDDPRLFISTKRGIVAHVDGPEHPEGRRPENAPVGTGRNGTWTIVVDFAMLGRVVIEIVMGDRRANMLMITARPLSTASAAFVRQIAADASVLGSIVATLRLAHR